MLFGKNDGIDVGEHVVDNLSVAHALDGRIPVAHGPAAGVQELAAPHDEIGRVLRLAPDERRTRAAFGVSAGLRHAEHAVLERRERTIVSEDGAGACILLTHGIDTKGKVET